MITVDIEYNGEVLSLGKYEPHRKDIQKFVDQNCAVGWINKLSIDGTVVNLMVSGYHHQTPISVAFLDLKSS